MAKCNLLRPQPFKGFMLSKTPHQRSPNIVRSKIASRTTKMYIDGVIQTWRAQTMVVPLSKVVDETRYKDKKENGDQHSDSGTCKVSNDTLRGWGWRQRTWRCGQWISSGANNRRTRRLDGLSQTFTSACTWHDSCAYFNPLEGRDAYWLHFAIQV